MKSKGGKSQRREEKRRRKKIKKRKSQKKEDPGARKGRKVAKHCVFPLFFQWFVAPEGRKVGSLKRRARSPPCSDHFSKLRCRKSACRCGAKHISKSKCTKHLSFGALLDVALSKKCTLLWWEAHFEVKMYKTHQVRTTFGSCDVEKVHAVVARSTFWSQNVKNTRLRGRRKGLWILSKVSKTWGYCGISKSDGKRGTFEEDLQRCISVARTVQETCLSEMLGGPGADFLRGVAFWSIRSSGLLRWFCATGAALRMTLRHFFVAGAAL